MGWSRGYEIFDVVVEKLLTSSLTRAVKCNIIQDLMLALEDHDWDTFADSAFCEDPIVLAARKRLHPDEFE